MADREESRQPPALRLVGIDREVLVAAAAGMRDVIDAAADRPLVPGVDDVEDERRVHRNRRVQAARRLPGPIADAGDELAARARRMQRHSPAVAREHDDACSVRPLTLTCSRSTDEST